MRDNLLRILDWQIEAGADEAIGEAVRNYTQETPKTLAPVSILRETAPNRAVSAPPSATAVSSPVAPAAAIAKAREMADSCQTLEQLEAAVRAFDGCAIKKTATNTVFCDGNPNSGIMLIGEAPGASEDVQGIPFCGASGKLLDEMMRAIGLDRTGFYITNTVFWRPPGNRQPNPEELAACRPFVEKHIALIQPKIVILVGGTATSAVLQKETGITRLRGKFYTYTNQYLDKDIPVGVIFHPSYLLRQPGHKRLAWADLLQIKNFIQSS